MQGIVCNILEERHCWIITHNPYDAVDARRICMSYAQDCALMKMVFNIATEGGDAHSSTDALEARGWRRGVMGVSGATHWTAL